MARHLYIGPDGLIQYAKAGHVRLFPVIWKAWVGSRSLICGGHQHPHHHWCPGTQPLLSSPLRLFLLPLLVHSPLPLSKSGWKSQESISMSVCHSAPHNNLPHLSKAGPQDTSQPPWLLILSPQSYPKRGLKLVRGWRERRVTTANSSIIGFTLQYYITIPHYIAIYSQYNGVSGTYFHQKMDLLYTCEITFLA